METNEKNIETKINANYKKMVAEYQQEINQKGEEKQTNNTEKWIQKAQALTKI